MMAKELCITQKPRRHYVKWLSEKYKVITISYLHTLSILNPFRRFV